MSERFQVAIVGGGPAGSLTALLLARKGCTVALLDQGRSSPILVGETLPPIATRILAELGLLKPFLEQRHRSSPGIISVWGGSGPIVNDFIFSPYGEGGHLARSRFNGLLLEAAYKAGATILSPLSVRSCLRSASGGEWLIQASTGFAITCKVLVDATGHYPANKLPHSSRTIHDRLIAVAGQVKTNADDPDLPAYTLIEAVRDGWFYSALLPNSQYIVTFTTDADVYAHGQRHSPTYLNDLLSSAYLTKSRIGLFPSRIKAFSAATSKRTVSVHREWIAIGDAAQSYDPLSGLGLLKAMKTAQSSTIVILEMLAGGKRAAAEYETLHHQSFLKYIDERKRYYSRERRWPDSPFWKRRQN